MQRILVAALVVLYPIMVGTTETPAKPGRYLPSGEEHPALIESIYSSPVGEVQFTRLQQNGHSGFLRNAKGYLIGFQEVRGHSGCEGWFLSNKTETLPSGCEFLFYDENSGRTLSVRSDEMEETSLFQTTRGKMREWGRQHVAL